MKPVVAIIGILFFSSAFCQEQCLQRAWDAFNRQNWRLAIQHAEDCTINFNPQARQIQRRLDSTKYVLPTPPYSAANRDEIFRHGLLNDVGTSYWLIGIANIRLRRNEAARRAFRSARQLTFALCFDPRTNSFWSPSEASSQQLSLLDSN